jgi:hypothetical protein
MHSPKRRFAQFASQGWNATTRTGRAPASSALGGLCVAVAASVFGGLGCGAAGTEETVSEVHEPLSMSTWNQLVAMPTTGSHTLTANIDAAGKTWTPKTFSGTFDGGNKTISNLTINGGSFFSSLTNATIKNVKFVNLRLTGALTSGIGGLATAATNTTIENCAVEATINVSAGSVGGLLGTMTGGKIERSYAKGTISGTMFYVGGLVGTAGKSSSGQATIYRSYGQVTVNPSTNASFPIVAGGIVGYGYAPDIHDVYAVGNVTGRGSVGGIAGKLDGEVGGADAFLLYKSIYRGEVIDKDRSSASGGWAGAVGTFCACSVRFDQNFYDRTLDPSSNRADQDAIVGYTTTELRSPTSVTEGVFCAPHPTGNCGDNPWGVNGEWNAGTSTQHHVLTSMPGPNSQPR